jgi:hypothetical protein
MCFIPLVCRLTLPIHKFRYELKRRLNADPALSRIAFLSIDPGGIGFGPALLRKVSFIKKVRVGNRDAGFPKLCPALLA